MQTPADRALARLLVRELLRMIGPIDDVKQGLRMTAWARARPDLIEKFSDFERHADDVEAFVSEITGENHDDG